MAYYTGVATSLNDILLALQSAAQNTGWSLSGDILHKDDLFVRAHIVTGTIEGIVLQGGIGIDAGALIDPSPVRARFGRPKTTDVPWTWPSRYFIHAHENPDEIYLIMNYQVDYYTWCAFGQSDQPGLNGTGLWLTGANGYNNSSSNGNPDVRGSYVISPEDGGSSLGWNNDYPSGGPFWHTGGKDSSGSSGHELRMRDTIHSNLNDYPSNWMGWSPAGSIGSGQWVNKLNAVQPAAPHIKRLPSLWNQEGILLPIQAYCWRSDAKCSLVLEMRHARYTRIDNYEPEQIISIGSDRWKIYPFIRKYLDERDGPRNGNLLQVTGSHTGTMGWAIRYDGS